MIYWPANEFIKTLINTFINYQLKKKERERERNLPFPFFQLTIFCLSHPALYQISHISDVYFSEITL